MLMTKCGRNCPVIWKKRNRGRPRIAVHSPSTPGVILIVLATSSLKLLMVLTAWLSRSRGDRLNNIRWRSLDGTRSVGPSRRSSLGSAGGGLILMRLCIFFHFGAGEDGSIESLRWEHDPDVVGGRNLH